MFMFNGVIYEQRDGVCIEYRLGSLLANVAIRALEDKVINDKKIKCYARYTNHTLFLFKRKDVGRIQNV